MMSKKATIGLAVANLLLVFGAWLGVSLYSHIPGSPELALKAFYERRVAEDQIMDPLILAGPAAVSLLEKEVADPAMANRRYAIGALGNLGSRAAIPILEKLARSASEVDYIRCDAITAIAMIDRQQGLRVINSAGGKGPDCFSEIADGLYGNYAQWLKSNAVRRTYFQAFLGWHH